MQNDKELEDAGSADSPRLVLAIGVDRVQDAHNGDVDQGDGEGDDRRQKSII